MSADPAPAKPPPSSAPQEVSDPGARPRSGVLAWIVLAVVVLAIAGLGVSSWLGRDEGGPAGSDARGGVPVVVAPIEKRTIVVRERYPGEIATDTAEIAARVGAHVEDIRVRIGDRVKVGDPLVVLDDELMRRELRGAVANRTAAAATVERSRTRLRAAEREVSRAEPLVARNVLSQQEVDALVDEVEALRADQNASKAQADAARARVSLLEEQLADTQVRAPFSGTIAERHVDPGAYVAAGAPLVRLVADGPFRVRFAIPERDIGRIEPGDPLEIETAGEVALRVRGKVTRLAGEVTRSDRTLAVEGELDPDERLRSGMYAEVVVEPAAMQGALVVPDAAVLERYDAGGERTVAVMVAREGKAVLVPIVVRGRDEGRVAIEGELAEGESVLVRGHRELADGAAIAVTADAEEG